MIFEKVNIFIKQEEMIQPGEKIVTALSGGIDSMVMLHLLKKFQDARGDKLVIAHLNHGLRGVESDRDEEFVKDQAANLGLECYCKKVDLQKKSSTLPDNLQEAGRQERYAFFNTIAKEAGANKIALGHNADDQCETVIMRFIRGSSVKGLGGIPPRRKQVIRPLLCLTRKEIEEYALKEGIAYVEDSSNSNKKYLRNRIRHELIPILKKYNPKIGEDLNILSHISRDLESYLYDEAWQAYINIRLPEETAQDLLFLDLSRFNNLPSALKGKIINIVFSELTGSSSGLYSTHILQVEALAERKKSGTSLDLPKGVKVFIEYEKIGFSLIAREEVLPFSCPLNLEGETIVANTGIKLYAKKVKAIDESEMGNKNIIYLNIERIKAPLVVRNFKNGDRIKIKGMKGRKKLKDLYIDEKVPPRIRNNIPLVTAGDEILWVVGLRQGGSAIADCHSQDILRVSKS